MTNIEIVDSLRSLYPLKDFEEEAIMEVVAEFRELKERATPKEEVVTQRSWGKTLNCPRCGSTSEYRVDYCSSCGQAILNP